MTTPPSSTPTPDAAAAPMRVAVVTPYYKTPDEWLLQCHESVLRQTYPCTHILVADGRPQDCVARLGAQHIVLPLRHADYGDTPRAVGSMSAIGQGFDAIAYLDSDNWYDPDHIASLVALHRSTGAAVVTARRSYHRLDGSFMADCLSSDGEIFCDTSCLMLTREAFKIAPMWALMDPVGHALDDRVMWYHVREAGLSRANTGRHTVGYRATTAGHYRDMKEEPPEGARHSVDIREAMEKWIAKGYPPLLVKWWYRYPRNRVAKT